MAKRPERFHSFAKAETQKQRMVEQIMDLTSEQRMILDLVVIRKMTVDQAANLSGFSVEQVRGLFTSALDSLKMDSSFYDG